jgi:hypothetical protein
MNTVDIQLPLYNFEMYTTSGERACRSAVKRIFNKIGGDKRMTEEEVVALCSEEIKKVSVKHPEVNDTEPEGHIAQLVSEKCAEVGYSFRISRYDF